MHYNISLKLVESLKNYIFKTSSLTNDIIFGKTVDTIEFSCPINPLPLKNEYVKAIIEVPSNKENITLKLPFFNNQLSKESFFEKISNNYKNIKNSSKVYNVENYSLKLKFENIDLEINNNDGIAYFSTNVDLNQAINELPNENIRQIIFDNIYKLYSALIDFSNYFNISIVLI